MDERGSDAGVSSDGNDSGLPPKAPAYDLRTGEPLDAPREDGATPASDFTASDLGIWAPSAEAAGEPTAPAAAAPDVPAQHGAAAYAPTPNPVSPNSVTPNPMTPPPGRGVPTAYSPTPPPGAGGPGPTLARQPTLPPGYQVPYQGSGSYSSSPGFSSPGFPPPGFPPGVSPTAHGPVPAPSRRGPWVLGAVVGVLVIVVAVLVAVVALGGNSPKTPVASTTTGTGTTAGGSTTGSGQGSAQGSTGSGSSTGSSSNGAQVAFLRTVDGILTQSASGRQEVTSVVNGVVNGCSVTPQDASATIKQVIVNRQSVLGQANALSAPDAATAAVKADLVQALNASIEANRGYQQWLDNLYTTYFNAQPVGCPNGQAPTDSNYDAATAASGRATTAKQSFVAAYNPLASAAGLRTWQDTEF